MVIFTGFILAFLSSLPAGVAAVKVSQSPPFLYLQKDEKASMTCTMEGGDTSWIWIYRWTLNGSSVINTRTRVMIPFAFEPSSLHIWAVTPSDSGLYVCSVRVFYPQSRLYSGNGTWLQVTAAPTMALRMEILEKHHLLICEAESFYPQGLNISWSLSGTGIQIREKLTENEDGTYTKRSSLEVAEEVWSRAHRGVTCRIQHVTLPEPFTSVLRPPPNRNTPAPGASLYRQLFPVRVLLALTLMLSPCICSLYIRCAM
ncbi:patr class I histocompatibility antigen, C alpha chain-like [Spea bombifrons]|uniref:patr class I histocompatibility antigen, C alpha chain-like n=1 Tax=Spea bombifrons TaxID=233779 RepID=UPI00234B254F|nr:patr class I histocompatibility antigen, C alpha chain-like [Spea bombifrons]